MARHESDFVRLHLRATGTATVRCSRLGLDWPPPERITLVEAGVEATQDGDPSDAIMRRTNMSQLTDEQIESMSHVARGAEYRYEEE